MPRAGAGMLRRVRGRCTSDESGAAAMAGLTSIQRSPVPSCAPGSRRKPRPRERAITHRGTAHFTVSVEVAAHIGRWDPARVLDDVEARSRVLNAYEQALASPHDEPGRWAAVGLELAVVALAQPYREHPQFHPAWDQ
jgi:hypothetical protein